MKRIPVVVGLLLVAVACSGGNGEQATPSTTTPSAAPSTSAESAGEFVVRVNTYTQKGQFGRAWKELYPAQKKLVSASSLANCWPSDNPLADPNVRLRVTEVYDEPWEIPGTELKRRSKAVTIQAISTAYLENGDKVTSVLDTWTQHAFRVGDRWAWIVRPDDFDFENC